MCVVLVNDELSQLSRKVYEAFVRGGIISQLFLHTGALCPCHPDALLTLILDCVSSSQHSWRVSFVGGMCSRGHPTVGKYFSVFNWLGLCDCVRDDKSCASVFLENWRLFWK